MDNILIDELGNCKLCDFGVSRFIQKDQVVNESCGTPAYLAPEIILEKGYYDFGVDIWSLGVLLFSLVTGEMPFQADTLEQLQDKILLGTFEFPTKYSIEESVKDLIH